MRTLASASWPILDLASSYAAKSLDLREDLTSKTSPGPAARKATQITMLDNMNGLLEE
jgi:hypothetical protein